MICTGLLKIDDLISYDLAFLVAIPLPGVKETRTRHQEWHVFGDFHWATIFNYEGPQKYDHKTGLSFIIESCDSCTTCVQHGSLMREFRSKIVGNSHSVLLSAYASLILNSPDQIQLKCSSQILGICDSH